MPKTNTDKCKDYYARLRQDPQKWAEFLAKRAAYKRSKKPRCEPTASFGVNPDRCEPKEDPAASHPRKKVSQSDFDALYEERAAIREFDGGASRATAEAQAMDELLKMLEVE